MPGTIQRIPFESRALRGNRIGDPHQRDLYLYLPPGYTDDPTRRYPAVLLLASHGSTAQALLAWRGWGESIDQQLDRLIDSGACPPCIVILPDTWTRFGGTLHLNSGLLGNYGDYVIDEIIPHVMAHYRVTPGALGIIGRSSGGYAALYHALTRPGLFRGAVCHSGDAYFEYSALPEVAKLDRVLAKFGGLDGLIAESGKLGPKDQAFFDAVTILTLASTFAANPDSPYGFDLPIDPSTGALNEAVWARCVAYDPVRLLQDSANLDALRALKLLFIDCGAFDEYNLQVGARLMHRALESGAVPHVYEEFPGGHRGTHFRYDVSLPLLVGALQAE